MQLSSTVTGRETAQEARSDVQSTRSRWNFGAATSRAEITGTRQFDNPKLITAAGPDTSPRRSHPLVDATVGSFPAGGTAPVIAHRNHRR